MSPSKPAAADAHLSHYLKEQGRAEQMVAVVGRLYRERGVVITVLGRKLLNAATIDIIKAHRLAQSMLGRELKLADTSRLLEALDQLPLLPCRIDLGKLAYDCPDCGSPEAFLREQLKSVLNGSGEPALPASQDVVLYGFGRVGRVLARQLIERTAIAPRLRLRAVVVRGSPCDLAKRASLLRRDSVHGPFNGAITLDAEHNALLANGSYIRFIHADAPEAVDYTEHGLNNVLVVDNTGMFKDEAGLARHLRPGASKVLLTAPAGGAVKNIVYGVNHTDIAPEDRILCAASCTTNAIVPVLKTVHDAYGIQNGHVETVHAYTNDQNLIDNHHPADRRGRSAPLNLVLTSTGAARAVAKCVPELAGKLTGNAIRVPTPNVSMAVISLNLSRATTREALNHHMREQAFASPLAEQIAYSSSTEVVSTDFVGTPEPAIFDAVATIVEDKRCVLYVWYDNEWGYAMQVLRVMRAMSGLNIPSLPVWSALPGEGGGN